MKKVICFFLILGISSCTSNTIFDKPKDLIPKDTMISLLTDMYLASSAKNKENKFSKKKINYMYLVNEKYKIDTLRFDSSNNYYVSKVDEYQSILLKVKKNIDSLEVIYMQKKINKELPKLSKSKSKNKILQDSIKIIRKSKQNQEELNSRE